MLTDKEKLVLRLKKQYFKQKEIALALNITPVAVNKFLKNIEKKKFLSDLTINLKRGYLTDKEIKIFKLIQNNYLQKDIAEKLNISQAAVSDFYNNTKLKIRLAKETLKLLEGDSQ
jgi:transcriptional regulator